MSASYRVKKPDKRFEEVKTYSNDVQGNITSILRIRAVSVYPFIIVANFRRETVTNAMYNCSMFIGCLCIINYTLIHYSAGASTKNWALPQSGNCIDLINKPVELYIPLSLKNENLILGLCTYIPGFFFFFRNCWIVFMVFTRFTPTMVEYSVNGVELKKRCQTGSKLLGITWTCEYTG